MADYDTGWKFPTTNGTPATYDGSATEFSNPSNAYSSNNIYATVVDNSSSYFYQSYGGFGISIPAGGAIVGMEVAMEGKTSTGVSEFSAVLRIHADSTEYTVTPGYPTSTEATYTYGGPTTLPPGNWTPTGFNDGNFWLIVRTGGTNDSRTIYLDAVSVKIYYSIPDDQTISKTESISIGENVTAMKMDLDMIARDSLLIRDTPDVYDGIARSAQISSSLPVGELTIRQRWAQGLTGGRPGGSTLRHGV